MLRFRFSASSLSCTMAEVVRGGEKNSYEVPAALDARCRNFLPTPLSGYELMPLTLRPTGLSSEIDKDLTPSTAGAGKSAASMRPAAVPTVCAGSGQ